VIVKVQKNGNTNIILLFFLALLNLYRFVLFLSFLRK